MVPADGWRRWAEASRQRWPFFGRWLGGDVGTLGPRELWSARLAQLGVAVAGCVLIGDIAFGSRNIGRGRSVTASSMCPSTPAAEPGEKRLSRVVDGVIHERSSYAVCTQLEVHPWVMVDLGKVRSVDRVVVHPRSDCCWGDYDLPMQVELSVDKSKFVALATKHKPFTEHAVESRRWR